MASWPPAWLTPVDAAAIARGDGDIAAMFAETFGTIGKMVSLVKPVKL